MSQSNHRSFLVKEASLIPNPIIATKTAVKKTKTKAKTATGIKKKTHTKGNNSLYMKDFEKLMKERVQVDNKSLKRVKVLKTTEGADIASKAKIYAAPQINKPIKKSKKNLNAVVDKQMYHKRVKSDQIYSVKLLMRGEDKLKSSKHKLANPTKQPSITRPATKKNDSVSSGYSQFAFKKSKGLQQSLLQVTSKKNTFKSEN